MDVVLFDYVEEYILEWCEVDRVLDEDCVYRSAHIRRRLDVTYRILRLIFYRRRQESSIQRDRNGGAIDLKFLLNVRLPSIRLYNTAKSHF